MMKAMMRPAVVVTMVLLLTGGPGVNAAADPGWLRCDFRDGQTWSYNHGSYGAAKSGRLAFDIQNIDQKAQSAQLKNGQATSELKLVQALDARHYIEVTVAGYLNITTVYDSGDDGGDTWLAVHSRHLGIVGQPVVSQYRGTCKSMS